MNCKLGRYQMCSSIIRRMSTTQCSAYASNPYFLTICIDVVVLGAVDVFLSTTRFISGEVERCNRRFKRV